MQKTIWISLEKYIYSVLPSFMCLSNNLVVPYLVAYCCSENLLKHYVFREIKVWIDLCEMKNTHLFLPQSHVLYIFKLHLLDMQTLSPFW